MSDQGLKILFVASEAEPFARAGGLGSVMYSLPMAMKEIGFDARLMIPRYLNVDEKLYNLEMEVEGLKIPTSNTHGEHFLICNVKKYTGQPQANTPVTTYFLENQEYYEQRANIYGYSDDPIRWALLSRGVLEFLKVSSWVPDVIVCSDWQTGYLPNYQKTLYREDPIISKIKVIFSIHNLSYQGTFRHRFVEGSDIDDGQSRLPAFEDPRLMKINGMKRGIIYSDLVNTVSPTYAKEILTEGFGEGLQDLLASKPSGVSGIMNGIDYDLWNPKSDEMIKHPFSAKKLSARAQNKEFLQKKFDLEPRLESFLITMVSRMTSQKGFDLIHPIIRQVLEELDIQMVVVGEGDTAHMKLFQDLQNEFPHRVAAHLKFDSTLPHPVFAGADALLVPSRFEPSGLTQIEAMHYGAIPIVRRTGGLADTVIDYTSPDGTGFVFQKADSMALLIALVRAYEAFQNKSAWQELQVRGMEKDFSWKKSAKEYEQLVVKAMQMPSVVLNLE